MGRPYKGVRRFGCKLTEKTYNDIHIFADYHRMTICGLIELSIVRYIQKPLVNDSVVQLQRRKKGILDIPYTFNLSNDVYAAIHDFVDNNKGYKITLSGVTETAIIEFMQEHSFNV